jgi:hypothetical protein
MKAISPRNCDLPAARHGTLDWLKNLGELQKFGIPRNPPSKFDDLMSDCLFSSTVFIGLVTQVDKKHGKDPGDIL